MKKAILVAIVSIGIAAIACNKNNDGDNEPVAAVDLVTSTTWRIDTIGFDMDKNGEIDSEVPGGLDSCDMDNTLTFSRDSTGVFDEGALKCDSADPQTIAFNWHLKANDSIINIDGNLPGELRGDINIKTLTDASFVMSKEINSTFPVPFNGNLIVSLQK